jgi:hypothetical protein
MGDLSRKVALVTGPAVASACDRGNLGQRWLPGHRSFRAQFRCS